MFRGRNTVEKYGEKRVLTAVIWIMDNKKAAEIQRLPYSWLELVTVVYNKSFADAEYIFNAHFMICILLIHSTL